MKLAFNSFKIKHYFSDPILDDFKSSVVYKFTCASCSSSYNGKTYHRFETRIGEHIKKDKKSLILFILTPPQHALNHIIIFLLK